ncbi:uncharacterized protein EDB91DRAFT_1082966 [Suillus paluster]|uniref:uncharacterized protein n=1 Tax=Suillus paluster TaxID=48578 RepID=UPI001B869AB7|nr:uncharacterized protein EDB91DRAFT_1082966 [Suillus paluster]KAG1737872.1 hypothetical protein EDB91DRAFT_1082966 [Suillus paluster]
MKDIWITPLVGEVPHWLDDQDIHDGICTMLKHDRCIKEQQHLGLESDNLCRWFGDELAAIELALQLPENFLSHYVPPKTLCFTGNSGTTLEEGKEEGEEDLEVFAVSFDDPPPEHIALADIINIDTPDSEDEEDINIATQPCTLIT